MANIALKPEGEKKKKIEIKFQALPNAKQDKTT